MGEKRLVGYVVGAPEAQSDELEGADLAGALRAHVAARLPEYMVPAAFVRLTYEAPQGEIETALAELWAELLGVERVGRHDHFFELGGHSLLAVQLLSRALDLGLTFSASDLFQAPVMKELASKIHLERLKWTPIVGPRA